MSTIDLNWGTEEDHNTIAPFLQETLQSSKYIDEHRAWIVHLFSYGEPQEITPLTLMIMLREGIIRKVNIVESPGLIKLPPNRSRTEAEYETMKGLVQKFIRQILTQFPGNTMLFFYSAVYGWVFWQRGSDTV